MNRSTLISVVQRGEAKHIMAAARKAGAPGGTVCNARGTATRTILAAWDWEIQSKKYWSA